MKAPHNRARIIITHEGRFINLDDIRLALGDDSFVTFCEHVVAVSVCNKDSNAEIIKCAIGVVCMVLAGDADHSMQKTSS